MQSDLIPGPPPPPPWQRVLRWSAIAAAVALLASLLWWGVPELRCGGINGVRYDNGECAGVTDGSFVYDPEFEEIQQKIAAENRRVAALAEEEGTPYVKVALMSPLTPTQNSPMDHVRVRSALEGAYVALRRANDTRELGDPEPLVQLHLANEGSVQEQWPTTVAALERMTEDDPPLVAVTGQMISSERTVEAAHRLSEHQIPMVVAVASADGIDHANIPGLIRSAPSNTDFALALRNHLDERDDLESGILVHDTAASDVYVQTLTEAYQTELSEYLGFSHQQFQGDTIERDGPQVYDVITRNICEAGPDMVLFAGRTPDLRVFVEALSERVCQESPISVLYASTGSSLLGDQDVEDMLEQHNISIVHAAASHPGWARGDVDAPEGFDDFHEHFRTHVSTRPEALDNGYAVTNHDALATTVRAIRLRDPWDPDAFTAKDVRDHLLLLNEDHTVNGAAGTLSFNENRGGNVGGRHVPVVELPYPGDHTGVDPYITPRE